MRAGHLEHYISRNFNMLKFTTSLEASDTRITIKIHVVIHKLYEAGQESNITSIQAIQKI